MTRRPTTPSGRPDTVREDARRTPRAASAQAEADSSSEGRTPAPDEIQATRAALLAAAAPKSRANLERLAAALESMRQRKQTDYSFAAVARAVSELGFAGPTYSSIKNAPGHHFRTLIHAYAAAYGATRATRTGEHDDDLALLIADQKVRARVRLLVAQVRALQHRNNLLHTQFQQMTAFGSGGAPLPPGVMTGPTGATTTGTAVSPRAAAGVVFSDDERIAVRRFLTRLAQHLWEVDDATGAITDAHGNEVAPPFFADALRRITDG